MGTKINKRNEEDVVGVLRALYKEAHCNEMGRVLFDRMRSIEFPRGVDYEGVGEEGIMEKIFCF